MSESKKTLVRHARTAVLVAAALGCDAALAIQVSVGQIDWLGDGGNPATLNSDWGRLSILFDGTDQGHFGANADGSYSGYVNAFTSLLDSGGNVVYSNNWAVQNAAITFSNASDFSGRLADGFHFDVSAGSSTWAVDLTGGGYTMQYSVSIDAGPVAPSVVGAAMSSGVAAIEDVEYRLGGLTFDAGSGLEGGYTGQAAPAKAQNFMGAAAGTTVTNSGSIVVSENAIAAVNEEQNGCAPGSAARSMAYLDDLHTNVTLPNNDPAKPDVQEAYEALRGAMLTAVGAGPGKGTTQANFESGKITYTNGVAPKVKTKQTVDVAKAIETLKTKGDVELMVYWGENAGGASMGGHAAFISGIQQNSDGSYTVTIIDDPKQGDGVAANNKYTLSFEANGALRGYGTGAGLIGFQTETVPEPGSLALVLTCAAVMGLGRKAMRRRVS